MFVLRTISGNKFFIDIHSCDCTSIPYIARFDIGTMICNMFFVGIERESNWIEINRMPVKILFGETPKEYISRVIKMEIEMTIDNL